MWLVGVVAVALLVLPWVIALALARHHHLDATAVGILAAVSIPLSALWIAWVTLAKAGGSSTSVSSLSLAQVADQLAVTVLSQWNAEAAIRRLNDPYPLPVSWVAADSSLTDSWDSLIKLANSGAGWPSPPPAQTWAADPEGLAGAGGELAEVLARVPTGRLVVLGEPGAGKTILMVRLVLDLLTDRSGGAPVPILASIASWNPAAQDLRGWLAAQLVIDYPVLADPPPADRAEPTQAEALLAAGLILPVLDGLDEIPEAVRGPAISRINDALRPGQQVVATCRTKQYRDAVRPVDGLEVTLRAAAAIQLRPLDAGAVRGYLCDDAAGPVTRARWDPVLSLVGTKAPVAQALGTPLMVGLARVIYNPRPGELGGPLRDPVELCAPALADRAAVESLLFDAFVLATYRHDSADRWKAPDAERWLAFLARYLDRVIGGPDLAWWRLPLATQAFAFKLWLVIGFVDGAGVAAGFVLAIAFTSGSGIDPTVFWNATLIAGVIGAAIGSLMGKKRLPEPARGIRWKPPGVGAVLVGTVVGIAFGVPIGFSAAGAGTAAATAAIFGFLAGGVIWLRGQRGAPFDSSAVSPAVTLARDRRTATVDGVMAGTVVAAALAVVSFLDSSGRVSTNIALAVIFGLGFGILAAAAVSLTTAWPFYEIARIRLALRHRLPWQLMDFLADAHKRGVLRQAGAVYQFRHIELQHRLANRDTDKREANLPAAEAGGGKAKILGLAVALAQGRLTEDEHAERVAQASASQSRAGLAALTADLPAGLLTRPPAASDVRTGACVIIAAASAIAAVLVWQPDNALAFLAFCLAAVALLVAPVITVGLKVDVRHQKRSGSQLPPGPTPGTGG